MRPTSPATFHADVLICPRPAPVYYSAPCRTFGPVLTQHAGED